MNLPGILNFYSFAASRLLCIMVAVFVWVCPVQSHAQARDKRDTTAAPVRVADSAAAKADTMASPPDTASVESKEKKLGIKIAPDALPAAVRTSARDSAVLDMEHNMFYLYGAAEAGFQDVSVKSGKLIFNQKINTLLAEPDVDSTGKKTSQQEFKQGTETFTYDTLKYNFKSKRAVVRNARSQYGEGFVISEQIKRNADESIYGFHSLYTTCNLDHPHFGIRAKKIKVIPGRVIASGPANLEIMDVPTPLFLPFGMFPIKQGERSGFIMPTYTIEENRGLGLQRGGYYFAVNDYLGVITQFDIFSKGSWGFFSTAQYNKRYQYTGSLALNYAYRKTGEVYDPESSISKDFQITWSHQVDPRSRPGTSFSASVNVGTSTYNQLNGLTASTVLNNTYSSSISYSKSWVGKPYSLNVSLRHSQNTLSRLVTVGLPEMNFNLGQFSPFQRKNMVGTPRWYEKISASYSVGLANRWNFYDTSLALNNIAFNDFDNAIKHTASLQANYNVFRYFTWNINVPYNEYWNTKALYRSYNPATDHLDSTLKTGFFATRDFSVNTSLSTRVYGMKMFKRGKIAGIRHVLTPTVGLSYIPGFAKSPYNYFYETQLAKNALTTYESPYYNTPFGGPQNRFNQGSVNFGLQNTLQMKVRTKDSTGGNNTKNISLIDGLSINGSYNLFADSNKMSNITAAFRTSILQIFNVSANAVFDPYRYNGTRLTREYLVNTGGGLMAFTGGSVAVGVTLSGKKKNKEEQDKATGKDGEAKRLLGNGGYDDYYDFNIPWNLNINAGVTGNRVRRDNGLADTVVFRPNLTFNGGFNLTERWKLNVNSGFSFQSFTKVDIGYTQIDISRDLHCWQMSLNLVPFGTYRSFHFTLQVKAAVLQDLKLTRRKAYQDNF
ncbi:putative LPS assembly protein LptD [Taibaiella chishuiensis]|uniref:LPS-assembly protein LptD central domain-containing protein n=1 Tax=Taibaiella chishuiensis TaxID=1434707 RepID=A0A2P8DD22_9BACT|nr:putative LPS assembly protein LptD [Taibaiella chishuiensis]PSK95120.1 hypothetical protein B0I18_1011284 [Taibaiella chishuiensis]